LQGRVEGENVFISLKSIWSRTLSNGDEEKGEAKQTGVETWSKAKQDTMRRQWQQINLVSHTNWANAFSGASYCSEWGS